MQDDEIIKQVVGKEIVDKLKPIKDIQVQIVYVENEIRDEVNKHKKKLEQLNSKRDEIRKKCKHEAIKQNVGCGYDDNYVECLICGYRIDTDSSAGYSG